MGIVLKKALTLFIIGILAASCGSGGAAIDGGTDGDGDDGGSHQSYTTLECLLTLDCARVQVAAHRGFHLDHPENSLASLRAAAEIGAELVEVDVRHTSDDILVLMHDSDVDRTTDGNGDVDQLTWEQIQGLRLDGGDPEDPEDSRIPLFSQALALADELGLMLYVDKKTDRLDLVLSAVQAGDYYHVALVRDSLYDVTQMLAQDDQILVMPAVGSLVEYAAARDAISSLKIVEISGMPDAEYIAEIHADGIKVQQDIMISDFLALVGDYTGWKDYIEAGVNVPQTDYPHLLIPALEEYEETGVFPETGPGI
jgi:glycerophosphoryl diester phosphodiesterase